MSKKIIHPVLGEVDVRDGPSVLDDEMTVISGKPILSAFESPLIEPETPRKPDPIPKRVKRRLINIARKVLDRIEDKK